MCTCHSAMGIRGLGDINPNFDWGQFTLGTDSGLLEPDLGYGGGGGGGGVIPASTSWNQVLQQMAQAGTSVFKDIYGGIRPGTFVQNRPGQFQYRLPEGSLQAGFTSFPSMGNNLSSYLPYVILIGGAVLIFGAMRK